MCVFKEKMDKINIAIRTFASSYRSFETIYVIESVLKTVGVLLLHTPPWPALLCLPASFISPVVHILSQQSF